MRFLSPTVLKCRFDHSVSYAPLPLLFEKLKSTKENCVCFSYEILFVAKYLIQFFFGMCEYMFPPVREREKKNIWAQKFRTNHYRKASFNCVMYWCKETESQNHPIDIFGGLGKISELQQCISDWLRNWYCLMHGHLVSSILVVVWRGIGFPAEKKKKKVNNLSFGCPPGGGYLKWETIRIKYCDIECKDTINEVGKENLKNEMKRLKSDNRN